MSYMKRFSIEDKDGIVLYRGITADNNRFYSYILSDKGQIDQMNDDYEASAKVNIRNYGQIIFGEWRKDPSESVQKAMQEMIEEGKFNDEFDMEEVQLELLKRINEYQGASQSA